MALITTREIAELNICVIRLTRLGEAEGEIVETQRRVTVPAVGEVIEVALDELTVRARVTHISSPLPGAERCFTIAVDELSSGYLLETLSALAQCADDGLSSGGSSIEPASTKPHPALEATLKLARQCHTLSRRALDQPKPDMAAAVRYMKVARRAGCLAAPYLKDEQLRRRIVGYKPMSEEEWGLLWPKSLPDCK
jgi:hypothetical protein